MEVNVERLKELRRERVLSLRELEEKRRLLQHHLAHRGRQAGGASPYGQEAGRSPGSATLRTHKGGLGMGKRGNGEGSIWRRKSGGWCAQYTVYISEGRKRRTLYGKTRQEVAAKLSRALADREGGLIFDAGSLTVGEYLAR